MRAESDTDESITEEVRERGAWDPSFGGAWSDLCAGVATQLREKQQRDAKARRVVSRTHYVTNPMRNVNHGAGDEVLGAIAQTLDAFGITRTPTQKLFHFWFTQSILEHVYGDEWDTSATRVLKRFGVTNSRTEVMVMTPRRFGKTWSVAMFVVAALLSVPGFKIAIFSTGKRASNSLMEIA
ncbi:MAG: hypothetical protein JKX97_00510, partial [Candidatus Lindowbacteria bacterium]|nr:hypothetical protein [Candidatus Lindowbacteria bacterium]